MRLVLPATSASAGMALGRACLMQPTHDVVDNRPLDDHEIDAELIQLHLALDNLRHELRHLREEWRDKTAYKISDINEFIDIQNLFLNDPKLLDDLEELIKTGRYRTVTALKKQRDKLVGLFEDMNNSYLRSRKEDIDQFIAHVIAHLQLPTSTGEPTLAMRMDTIYIADNIAPIDLMRLSDQGLLGIVTRSGSPYSHSAILANSLNLPMLVGTQDAILKIQDNDLILVDANQGQAVVHPSATDLTRYRNWQRESILEGRNLAALTHTPIQTLDGVDIKLLGNVESSANIALARSYGADGIGLYRTEFLFLRHHAPPTEEEQFVAYRDLVLGMAGLPVTIRTLDLGADKADATGLPNHHEDNPALGVRGVRLALRYPDLFTSQIRAILRAAHYGPVRVLIPMVTQVDELIAVHKLFRQAHDSLQREQIKVFQPLPLGAMIEVPAAALHVRALLEHVDFLAIGTNDLAQYLLATDRNNEALEDIYTPLQPVLLRLIAHVINQGRRTGKPVHLCGEMGGDTRFTALLIALGLTQFSMHPKQLLKVRKRISTLRYAWLRQHAKHLLRAHNQHEVEALLMQLNQDEPEALDKLESPT